MIGYYVHHHGSGHLHRATAINEALGGGLTGLSTHPRPSHWTGDWVELCDDAGATHAQVADAGGALHYAPEHHGGLRSRMAQISTWIERSHPEVLVVDVSVEVALLARLHGVPVVAIAMPGPRGDRAHQLGYDVSRRVLAPWPVAARGMWPSATAGQLAKTQFIGAISRYAPQQSTTSVPGRVVILNGTGGQGPSAADVQAARDAHPDREWIHLDRAAGTWLADPWPVICSASVVVSHAGQNAIAEIAAARRPAVLIPQHRPFDEQRTTAATLAGLGWPPVVVRKSWPQAADWAEILHQAESLDGSGWADWNDGAGAGRAARVLTELGSPTVTSAQQLRPAAAVTTFGAEPSRGNVPA